MAGGHRRQESMYAMTGLYSEPGEQEGEPGTSEPQQAEEHRKSHSRNPSNSHLEK